MSSRSAWAPWTSLPTLLALAGAPVPDGLLGRDLGPALRGERLPPQPLYAESLFGRLNCRWASLRVLFDGDWKLIEGREPELFDLAADPAESEGPRGGRADSASAGCARRSARRWRAWRPAGDSARIVAIAPEQVEKLRSLGYTGGGSAGAGPLDDRSLPDPRTHVHLYEKLQKAMTARGPAAAAALRDIEEVARVDPDNPYAHFALGGLAYREGRLARAAAAYARGLELDPDRPGMRLPYGNLLRDMQRLEDSERQLRIALEQTTPDDHRTRIGLAETLTARGQTAEAETLLAGVLARAPGTSRRSPRRAGCAWPRAGRRRRRRCWRGRPPPASIPSRGSSSRACTSRRATGPPLRAPPAAPSP